MDSIPYNQIADDARDRPGVWILVREGLTSANFVTQVRQGKVPTFPARYFSAKSIKEPSGWFSVYVQYVPASSYNSQEIAYEVVQQFTPRFEQLFTEMLVTYGQEVQHSHERSNKVLRTELDIAYDHKKGTLDEALQDFLDGIHGLKYSVVKEVGPGGGWPVVRFEGSEESIYQLHLRYANDQEEAKYFQGSAQVRS